jgi:hypothetical protein
MVHDNPAVSQARSDMLRRAARIGAITAEALAEIQGAGLASARAQLAAAERRGLLRGRQPLAAQPRLYTVTRAGLRHCGEHRLEPGRVSATGALHLVTCARVAAQIERRLPGVRVMGERELRRDEREHGRALASARLRLGGARPELHRPDLVLWPAALHGRAAATNPGLPIAVEVELTVKAPRRLSEIVAGWARCRLVGGVIYLAAPDVEPALARALDRARAAPKVTVVPLSALDR